MNDPVAWAIIALFYAPLHYLLPLLIVFFRNADDPALRRRRLKASAIDCTLSMAIAFALVLFVVERAMLPAMTILLLSLLFPYLRLLMRLPGGVEDTASG